MKLQIITALCLSLAANFSFAADAFLDIPSIPGESTDSAHAGEIEVISWSQSVANVNAMPVVLPLVIEHNVDKATPKLIEAALLGTDLETTTLTLRTQDVEPVDYYFIELNQTKVVSVRTSAATELDPPVETVTLTCATFKITYRERLNDGSLGPPIETMGNCGN